jgi:type II secretory pathway component PulC
LISGALLTRGVVDVLTRSLRFLAGALAVGGLLLQVAPSSKVMRLNEVSAASARQSGHPVLVFPRFGELQSERANPFAYRELIRVPVPLRQRPEETKVAAPDLAGLELIGTAPGPRNGFAVVRDQQANVVSIIERGAELRGLKVRGIHADRVALAQDEQQAVLVLSPIKGSDALSQQMLQTPPAQGELPAARKGAGSVAAADPKAEGASSVIRPARSMGISGYILPPAKQQELGLEQLGLFITAVQSENSPIKVNDVLLNINGQNFSSIAEALALLQQVKGDSVSVRLLRDKNKVDTTVPLK